MRPSSLLLACTLLLSLLAGAVRADGLPSPTPEARTLAQALAALPPPKQDLFVSVGADRVVLPPGAPPPDPDSRPNQVGAAYGRLSRDFGGVMALAPPTMVVLNTRPGVPDPYNGMPPEDALKLLLAGLTPPQWAALTGPSGLGLADLSDDAQRALFEALLPSGDVTAYPQATMIFPTGAQPAPILLTAADLRAVRLHLGRQTQMLFSASPEGNFFTGSGVTASEVKRQYNISMPGTLLVPRPAGDKAVYGAVLRRTVLNSPKDADLDYDAPALKRSIRVDGIATVGDLVARVGQAAGLELYADRHYEKRTVTLVGRRTARAVDLLRAVAFCVTGTFRRVGPAYVLTDDREGTAPRRQRLTRFVQEAKMARHAALQSAGDNLVTMHGGADALPPLDGLGATDAQKALPSMPGLGSTVRVTFAQLTPAQQEYAAAYVRRANEGVAQIRRENEAAGRAEEAAGQAKDMTLDGPFLLSASPLLSLQCPAVPGPITLSPLSADALFQRSSKLRRAQDHPFAPPRPVPPSALAALLAPLPRRAVLAAPRTAQELDQVIAAMKVLGLNQLWLDVFSGGHSHLDSPLAANNGGTGEDSEKASPTLPQLGIGGPDILTEALARTKGMGIVVVPALDLLRWGADAPAGASDRTALGETSAQQQAWQRRYTDVTQDRTAEDAARTPPPDVWACPAAPPTEAALLALVRRLAATPGVTTLALHGTVPPGYDRSPGPTSGIGEEDLGYVPALRLAFLRRDHLDPLDLDTNPTLPGGADVSLPEFGGWTGAENPARDWNALRNGAGRDLLRRLLAAAQEAGGRVRFLVSQRGDAGMGGWYGLWDDPQAPLPEVPEAGKFDPLHPPWEINYALVAHAQSQIALYALPAWAGWSPYITADMLRKLKPGWDGVVLDVTDPAGGDSLAALAGQVPLPAPKPVPKPVLKPALKPAP